MLHPTRPLNKTLLIGWDAADWMTIQPLLEKGKLPHLSRLITNGSRGPLKTLEPKLSPLLWNTIATGKTADRHGILNFVEPGPEGDGLRVSQSTSRSTKAIWNILSQNDLETVVVGWYASHPAEKIKGAVVTNLLHEGFDIQDKKPAMLPGTLHPESEAEAIQDLRLHHSDFPEETLKLLLPRYREVGWGDERVAGLKKKMAYAESVAAAALYLLQNRKWHSGFIFFDAIDTMGHQFMQYRAPKMNHVSEKEMRWFGEVMDQVYIWHDLQLGRLMEAAGPDTNIMVISDHGFHNGHLRPNLDKLPPERRMELEASWHRPYGIIVAAGPDILKGAVPGPVGLLDICPTILHLMNLQAAKDMSGRVIKEILHNPGSDERIESWDLVEGEDGVHPPEMRSNPIDTGSSIRQLIDLGYLAAIPESTRDQIDLVLRESRFNLALLWMNLQKTEQAIPVFRELYEEKPDTSRYLACLAQCHWTIGNAQEIIPVLEKHLRAYPGHAELRLLLCNCYLINRQKEEAMKMLPGIRKDLVEHPGNTLGFVRLLFDLGNYLDASISILPFAKTHLTDPSYLVLAAKIHLANGLIEEAAGQLLDAMEISQAMPEAHYLLGLALLWLGDVGHAEQSLKNAIQFMADYEQAHRLLSAVFYQQGLNELSQHHHQVAGSLKKSVYNEIENNHPHHLLHYLRQKGLMHLK